MTLDREQALDTALGQIERQFGKGAVMKMNDAAQVAIGAVSTGSLSLDIALGVGGLPRGRVCEVYGPESSGKTTLVYHGVAEGQRRGGVCALIRPEHPTGPADAQRALRFYASIRMDIRRIETLKEGVEAIGNRVRVKVVKNKVAPPFKQAEFDIIYGDGISWEGSVLEVGIERKVVQKSGSYFSYGDERLGQGRQNATAFLREHPDVVQAILREIQAAAPG